MSNQHQSSSNNRPKQISSLGLFPMLHQSLVADLLANYNFTNKLGVRSQNEFRKNELFQLRLKVMQLLDTSNALTPIKPLFFPRYIH